ncbi:Bug family tripartite tricarboxylate transporter substrate binding protein [Comamonas sp. 4034]|uniref:Bug family tripartite tricarboxylate transporter substrate binding protein n=1 Tax=Comamonas sp. 4034 TaxID=3156455 RepID=UPI003D258A0E
MNRRHLSRLALLLPVVLLAGAAAAQGTAGQPITFVVPSAAGGSPDVLSRIVTNQWAQNIHRTVVVENKPGAAGNIGIVQVVRGNDLTVGYGNINTLAVNRSLFSTLPYDVDKDLVPVSHLFNLYNVLIVPAGSSVHSVKDLMAEARKSPGKLSYGASGVGTTGHMSGELLNHLEKLDTLFVPYQGGPAALQDLMGGRLNYMFVNSSEAVPLIKAGKVRALAVTRLGKRIEQLPEVPTMDEAGVKGYEIVSWGGVVGNRKMTPEQAKVLAADLDKVLKAPNVRESLNGLGAQPVGGTPDDFRQLIARETKKWAEIIQSSKIEKLN